MSVLHAVQWVCIGVNAVLAGFNAFNKRFGMAVGSLVLIVLFAFLLSACCPISLRPELTHVSHVSQHFSRGEDYGYNAALVDLHLEPVRHLNVDIAEGMILNSRDTRVFGADCYGGMLGPREIFTATIAWDVPLRR